MEDRQKALCVQNHFVLLLQILDLLVQWISWEKVNSKAVLPSLPASASLTFCPRLLPLFSCISCRWILLLFFDSSLPCCLHPVSSIHFYFLCSLIHPHLPSWGRVASTRDTRSVTPPALLICTVKSVMETTNLENCSSMNCPGTTIRRREE